MNTNLSKKKKIKELREIIDRYNTEYYENNTSLISDSEYDMLMNELIQLENEYPELISSNSPTQKIGSKPLNENTLIKHTRKMLSLQNTYTFSEIEKFLTSNSKHFKNVQTIGYCCEMKVDGIAVSLYYENGKFLRGMTRGNGVYGEDITKNIHEIKSIPMEIKSTKNPLIKELANSSFEVRGEVYIKLSDFNAINEIRRLKGEIEFQNPRNAAGGSLKLLDPLEVSSRKLSALFYYIDSHSPLLEKIESQYLRIQLLREIGFFINSNVYYSESLNEIYEKISNWYEVRRELDFEIDGAVIKVDNVNYWNILGETAKYPKWAIAYKFTSFKEKSQIVNVEFQVGRTGIITPVAELTPVKISGSIVSRASLYNIEEIKRLNIAIGDKVLVEKAGDVIPKILKLESPADSNLRKEIILPEFCPSCGTKLKVRKSVIGLFCENTMNCKQRIKAEILYFCSKEAMNIQFVGSSLISDLYDNGLISDIGDLYYLNENQLKHLNKIKDKSSNRILSSIRTSKGNSPVQILIGLGIEHVGEQIARKLLAKFESIKNLMNASIEDVLAVPNIGAVIAESVHNFFQQPHKKSVIHKLENVGFDFSKKDEPELINNSLNGKIFVFTGTLSSLKREDAKMKVKMLGGTTSDTISKETSYLVATETNSAKYKKAVAIGTKILSETDFLTMVN